MLDYTKKKQLPRTGSFLGLVAIGRSNREPAEGER
jgi:hypothetical protein